MVEVTEKETRPAPFTPSPYMLGTAVFAVAGVLVTTRPEPLAAEVVGLLASLVILAAALRDPRPHAWRTFMRIVGGLLAATFVVLAMLSR
jgi:hypothetical protein